MSARYRAELVYRCGEWTRGRKHDAVDVFEDANVGDRRDEITIAYEMEEPYAPYTDVEKEVYRLARNRAENRLEMEGWSDAMMINVEIEPVDNSNDDCIPKEDLTIDDVKNWEKEIEDGEVYYVHEYTDDYVQVKEDTDPNTRWHSEMNADRAPWAGVYCDRGCLLRYETEEEARQGLFNWMRSNPYSLDPADTHFLS